MIQSRLYGRNFLIYPLAFTILLFSGVNFFTEHIYIQLGFLIVLILLYIRYPSRIRMNFILFSIGYLIVFLLQSIFITWISPYYFIRYFSFVLLIPYILLTLLPINYNDYVVKIVFYLTIVDLVIWSISIISPYFDNLIYMLVVQAGLDPVVELPKSIIVYTHDPSTALGIRRFAGFWHEPGAFAVLMGYVLFFNTIKKNTLVTRENAVFIIAILATFSTTAYIALGISFYIYLIAFLRKNILLKIVLLPFVIYLTIFLYNNLNFMEKKVEAQMENQMAVELSGSQTSGRILGFRKSLNVIKTYPLFGRGLSSKTQAEITSDERTGYGWPGYFARIGIPLALVIVLLFYRSFKFYTEYYRSDKRWIPVYISLISILLFSQKHTASIILMMFYLSSIVYSKRILVRDSISSIRPLL